MLGPGFLQEWPEHLEHLEQMALFDLNTGLRDQNRDTVLRVWRQNGGKNGYNVRRSTSQAASV
jgi:hypothetical protein